jgi:hypothetical protein
LHGCAAWRIAAGPKYGEECILTADLDWADLARAKFDFNVVGHCARLDVFKLHVNEQAMKPVAFDKCYTYTPSDQPTTPRLQRPT